MKTHYRVQSSDIAEMIHQYKVHGKSIPTIAKDMGFKAPTVYRHLIRVGVYEKTPRKKSNKQKDVRFGIARFIYWLFQKDNTLDKKYGNSK